MAETAQDIMQLIQGHGVNGGLQDGGRPWSVPPVTIPAEFEKSYHL